MQSISERDFAMSWYATSKRRRNQVQTIPQSADTPTAVQNRESSFCNNAVALLRWGASWRWSDAMWASNVAIGRSINATFATGPAVESKRCFANATFA